MQDLTVTLLQSCLAWHDPAANRAHFGELVRSLPGPTDLVVLPEMFTTGFTMATREQAETMSGPSLGWMAGLARELDTTSRGQSLVDLGGAPGHCTVTLGLEALHRYREKFPAWRDADDFRIL